MTATAADVRGAVLDVLRSPDCRAAAGRLRDECAALPSADDALDLLEQLARLS